MTDDKKVEHLSKDASAIIDDEPLPPRDEFSYADLIEAFAILQYIIENYTYKPTGKKLIEGHLDEIFQEARCRCSPPLEKFYKDIYKKLKQKSQKGLTANKSIIRTIQRP